MRKLTNYTAAPKSRVTAQQREWFKELGFVEYRRHDGRVAFRLKEDYDNAVAQGLIVKGREVARRR